MGNGGMEQSSHKTFPIVLRLLVCPCEEIKDYFRCGVSQ